MVAGFVGAHRLQFPGLLPSSVHPVNSSDDPKSGACLLQKGPGAFRAWAVSLGSQTMAFGEAAVVTWRFGGFL